MDVWVSGEAKRRPESDITNRWIDRHRKTFSLLVDRQRFVGTPGILNLSCLFDEGRDLDLQSRRNGRLRRLVHAMYVEVVTLRWQEDVLHVAVDRSL